MADALMIDEHTTCTEAQRCVKMADPEEGLLSEASPASLTLMAITIEQLEKLVGHEYAAIPVSHIPLRLVFPLDHLCPN